MELLILKLSETLLRFRRAKAGSLAVPVARQASVRCDASCIATSEHSRIIGPRQQKSRSCVLRIGGAFKQQSRRADVAERQHFLCACQQRCQCFGIERFRRRSALIPVRVAGTWLCCAVRSSLTMSSRVAVPIAARSLLTLAGVTGFVERAGSSFSSIWRVAGWFEAACVA